MVHLSAKLSTSDENLNYGAIYYTVFPLPAAPLAEITAREHNPSRVLIDINGLGKISSGLMPDGKGNYFVTIGKEIRKKFKLELDGVAQLIVYPDDSEYGMPLPEELAELWAMDEQAYDTFHRLPPGKQRSLMYLIAKVKRPETRAKKAVQISEYLKSTNGVVDYRELNAYMKADNANW